MSAPQVFAVASTVAAFTLALGTIIAVHAGVNHKREAWEDTLGGLAAAFICYTIALCALWIAYAILEAIA